MSSVKSSEPGRGTTRSSPSGAVDFSALKMDSHDPLHAASERVTCPGCDKSRRYWCCECARALVDGAPRVRLPLQVSVVQAAAELPKRSTAQHAQILSDDAKVHRPFPACADEVEALLAGHAQGSVALLYPSDDAVTPEQAVSAYPDLKRLVVIDANWSKSVSMAKHPVFKDLPKVKLSFPEDGTERMTRFWRYSPTRKAGSAQFNEDVVRGLLSTIEAIHSFCDSYGVAKGTAERGDVDNLLWLFSFNHGIVKKVYEEHPGKRARIMRKSKGLLAEF